jgi:hypothetical protein
VTASLFTSVKTSHAFCEEQYNVMQVSIHSRSETENNRSYKMLNNILDVILKSIQQ